MHCLLQYQAVPPCEKQQRRCFAFHTVTCHGHAPRSGCQSQYQEPEPPSRPPLRTRPGCCAGAAGSLTTGRRQPGCRPPGRRPTGCRPPGHKRPNKGLQAARRRRPVAPLCARRGSHLSESPILVDYPSSLKLLLQEAPPSGGRLSRGSPQLGREDVRQVAQGGSNCALDRQAAGGFKFGLPAAWRSKPPGPARHLSRPGHAGG